MTGFKKVPANLISNEDTYVGLSTEDREKAVICELLPFAAIAFIPIFITIIIALTFGPEL
jgi:hypothetical protein